MIPEQKKQPRICCLSCRYDLQGLDKHRCPECGAAFDPTDPATYALIDAEWPRGIRIALRVWGYARVLTVPLASWLFYSSYGQFRSQDFISVIYVVASLAFAAMIGGFFILISWLGTRRRTYIIAVLISVTVSLLGAEIPFLLQEHLLLERALNAPPTTTIFEDRWFPWEHHYIYFDPVTGETGGGC